MPLICWPNQPCSGGNAGASPLPEFWSCAGLFWHTGNTPLRRLVVKLGYSTPEKRFLQHKWAKHFTRFWVDTRFLLLISNCLKSAYGLLFFETISQFCNLTTSLIRRSLQLIYVMPFREITLLFSVLLVKKQFVVAFNELVHSGK